jgi:hypothetical protein
MYDCPGENENNESCLRIALVFADKKNQKSKIKISLSFVLGDFFEWGLTVRG